MARRTKLLAAATAVLGLLALTGAAYAWFVSLNATPPGVVRSALVRCLPDSGEERSMESFLTYGSLVSGNSIDPEGVPLILPGDWLLSSTATQTNAATQAEGATTARTVRTSRARLFQAGETPGTVIRAQLRYSTGPEGAVTAVTRTQRDLMAVEEADIWYQGPDDTYPVLDPAPVLNLSDYVVVTTRHTDGPTTAGGVTTTITSLTTAYTPRDPDGQAYTHVHSTREDVTHESPTFSPGGWDQATFSALEALPRFDTEETVLSVPEKSTQTASRTYLVLTETRPREPGDADSAPAPLALGLGNCSTEDVCVRVGVSAVVVRGANAESLTLRQGADSQSWYLGKESGGRFIELLALHTYAETGGYRWALSGDSGGIWSLWDLTLPGPDGTGTTAVPAPTLPAAAESPSASPASPAPAAAAPGEAAVPEPGYYAVFDELSVVTGSHFGVEKAAFEQLFNDFYCNSSPTLQLRIRYYVRQSDYMDWSEFYSQSLDIKVGS